MVADARARGGVGAGGPPPHPPVALAGPSPADQRPGEPVAVLRKIVAETAFDTGRALVGRVELDVGRGDARYDLAGDDQVHLAADAAAGAHGPHHAIAMSHLLGREAFARHHLAARAGAAYSDARPA